MVVLIGPSSRVTQVRNSLGPLLDSLVQKTVTIDLPGALPYFQSFPGKEKLLSVGHSQKCLIQFQKPEKIKESGVGLSQGITIVDRYCLDSGLQVLVCQGDITEEHADALVNAANEDLNHGGGVAAALSRAGGPQVQKESSTLVKQVGKIRTGEVVVTTGGNLNCKKLLHAVGPVQGKAVKLQLVCGDIIHETTDVIVNTTDFSNNQSGTLAPFAKLGIPSDFMCTTGPGALRCKEIFHASFKREAQRIRRICAKILKDCESKGYHSAAFPAINTGLYSLPQHWEPMAEETFKRVELRPDSQEYQEVAMGFQKTAKQYNIHKIERVQNYSLWLAYALCRQRILTKNGSADLGEKMLYHGTAAESCTIIEKSKFDRNFAGEHAVYGRGVYFAVEAQYSARGYSPRDSSGLKRLYRARVLTGRYTVGNLSMKAPPPRSATDPTDCFDSLVDNQQQPSMFVIFHDDQAYPEYRITFS
uniref:Poly [ADP-ribose] polymerase n=1 Tax=Myripristis murdjan TaxID=586833 RepID=A0A667WN14_9TELE